MHLPKILTIATAALLISLVPADQVSASPMPWERRPEPAAVHVPQPGPEWDAIFPKGFSFDIPQRGGRGGRAQIEAIPYERFDRLRIGSDGKPATEIEYLSNIVQALLTTSTDDILRSARTPDVRVNLDERLRFFLGPAWQPYELYLTTQKNRLISQLPSSTRMRMSGLRVIAELNPDTRKLVFADGRGTFATEGWLSEGIFGGSYRGRVFTLKLDFITDKASPDIIISKWDMTIRDNVQ